MKRPPMLMRVRIQGKEENVNLWLPLFLLLPLMALLLPILLPLILLVVLVSRSIAWRRRMFFATLRPLASPHGIRAAVDLLCSTPGLQVAIVNRKERLYISVV